MAKKTEANILCAKFLMTKYDPKGVLGNKKEENLHKISNCFDKMQKDFQHNINILVQLSAIPREEIREDGKSYIITKEEAVAIKKEKIKEYNLNEESLNWLMKRICSANKASGFQFLIKKVKFNSFKFKDFSIWIDQIKLLEEKFTCEQIIENINSENPTDEWSFVKEVNEKGEEKSKKNIIENHISNYKEIVELLIRLYFSNEREILLQIFNEEEKFDEDLVEQLKDRIVKTYNNINEVKSSFFNSKVFVNSWDENDKYYSEYSYSSIEYLIEQFRSILGKLKIKEEFVKKEKEMVDSIEKNDVFELVDYVKSKLKQDYDIEISRNTIYNLRKDENLLAIKLNSGEIKNPELKIIKENQQFKSILYDDKYKNKDFYKAYQDIKLIEKHEKRSKFLKFNTTQGFVKISLGNSGGLIKINNKNTDKDNNILTFTILGCDVNFIMKKYKEIKNNDKPQSKYIQLINVERSGIDHLFHYIDSYGIERKDIVKQFAITAKGDENARRLYLDCCIRREVDKTTKDITNFFRTVYENEDACNKAIENLPDEMICLSIDLGINPAICGTVFNVTKQNNQEFNNEFNFGYNGNYIGELDNINPIFYKKYKEIEDRINKLFDIHKKMKSNIKEFENKNKDRKKNNAYYNDFYKECEILENIKNIDNKRNNVMIIIQKEINSIQKELKSLSKYIFWHKGNFLASDAIYLLKLIKEKFNPISKRFDYFFCKEGKTPSKRIVSRLNLRREISRRIAAHIGKEVIKLQKEFDKIVILNFEDLETKTSSEDSRDKNKLSTLFAGSSLVNSIKAMCLKNNIPFHESIKEGTSKTGGKTQKLGFRNTPKNKNNLYFDVNDKIIVINSDRAATFNLFLRMLNHNCKPYFIKNYIKKEEDTMTQEEKEMEKSKSKRNKRFIKEVTKGLVTGVCFFKKNEDGKVEVVKKKPINLVADKKVYYFEGCFFDESQKINIENQIKEKLEKNIVIEMDVEEFFKTY